MTNEGARECLEQALRHVSRLERRMIGHRAGVLNATRNADRVSLSNDADSMRLELLTVYELLRDALGSLKPD